MSLTRRFPSLSWILARIAFALMIGAAVGLFQWSQHSARRREDEAALQLDRQLGVTVEPLDADVAADLSVPPGTNGLVVTSLSDGRSAARAGIQPGDVIEQIGGLAVTDPEAAADALRLQPQPLIGVIVNRHGKDLRLVVSRG